MTRRVWTFELDGAAHTVELQHRVLPGRKQVLVDGRALPEPARRPPWWGLTGGEYRFAIGRHKGLALIRNNVLAYAYDLAIDGKSVDSGKAVVPPLAMPAWAWLFVAGCASTAVAAGGGALPITIALAAIIGVINVARDASKSAATRVALSALVLVLAWVAMVVDLFIWAALRQSG